MSVLIVGASVAGVRTVQSLRSAGYTGAITILGEESHHPYDKPPISKEMLLPGGDGRPVPLLSGDELADLQVDLRLGVRATGLDTGSRTVTTDAGPVRYDELVIATGASARTLPGTERLPGVYTLRNAEDAIAVRAELVAARTAVVIGAGFIGAEFASSACAHGLDVTMVEMQQSPMAAVLGARVGELLGELHTASGVTLHIGVGVARVVGTDRVTGVVLTDGRTVPADLVVIGIGAVPATSWLAGSGVPIDDGVLCDERLRVVGVEHVHAVGDVARWPHPFYRTEMRIEHWTNAGEHGAIVAADLTGARPPRTSVPYVWSDQHGHRIQIVGRPGDGEPVVVHGGPRPPLAAVYTDPAGTLVGALVVDDPRLLMKCRKAITARARIETLDLPAQVPTGT